jgi:hypothetical protein
LIGKDLTREDFDHYRAAIAEHAHIDVLSPTGMHATRLRNQDAVHSLLDDLLDTSTAFSLS